MQPKNSEFPLEIHISFKLLFDAYREQQNSDNDLFRVRAGQILALEEKYPVLSEGLKSNAEIDTYKPQIDLLLEDVFATVLQKNEIKIATTPYNAYIFKATERYKKIIALAGQDFSLNLMDFDDDLWYIFGCNMILNSYYGYKIDFKRPFYYNIPNEQGEIRNYKVTFNADFVNIEKTKKARDISQEDVDILLESFDDIAVWKEMFPPNSWIFKGFIISTMYDATIDVSLSEFKTNLLRRESKSGILTNDFERIFKSIFNLPDLQVGFSDFNEEDESFERLLYKDINSFILFDKNKQDSSQALCSVSQYTLFKQKGVYCVSNTEKYHKLYPENILYKKLLDQNIKSCILASIVDGDRILGILELVSPNINDLNTINANKLQDVMPYLQDFVARAQNRFENEIELVIQEECTSIHSSVHWKFRKEAKRYLNSIFSGNPTMFREIVFEDVYPLYGQTDIKGSSEARNVATQKDLRFQLEQIQAIIQKINTLNELPIYEQLQFRIASYLNEIEISLQVDTERTIFTFLRSEINPLLNYLSKRNEGLREMIDAYTSLLDENTGFIYKHRKDYDDSVMQINKKLASIIDRKQDEAQKMYPHYFERFKTDGVEHNLYVGTSISKNKDFNKIYLRNLKLWQLQAVWEMENEFYKMKDRLPISLDVASMILAFNGSLSLRFRMDEKRFDVDGTYNARYEVVKKRVDKANIKGTEERVTQAGKISIIYSQKEDEEEYLKYINFLQHNKYLEPNIEILELEDLQGVTGLKALRVGILYAKKVDNNKEYYTYDDLISHIEGDQIVGSTKS